MKWRRILIGTGILLVTVFIAYFICRNALLAYAFGRFQKRSADNYHVVVNSTTIHFTGFNRVLVKGLVIQPEGADTLLTIESAECKISWLSLFKGHLNFTQTFLTGANVTIFNDPVRNNIRFRRLLSANPEKRITGFYNRSAQIGERIFQVLDAPVSLTDIHIAYTDSAGAENVFIPDLVYDGQQLSGTLINSQMADTILVEGKVLQKNKLYSFASRHEHESDVYLPFIDRLIKCRFRSVKGEINLEDTAGELDISTYFEAADLHVNHWRIAENDVVCSRVQFKGLLKVHEHVIELDSSSTLQLQGIGLKLFANYSTRPDTTFAMSIQMPETVADTFFNSLPVGMFNTLKGISCTGTLAYDLQFSINTALPDSLTFYSSLKRKNFRLNHYGTEHFDRVNEPFMYIAYDRERLVRQFEIGLGNPAFTPLNQISQYLPKAVLQSEDPSFMQHRGFLPESFRESIVQNYKEKRFARGGSTISMQFVKNVYLSRNKTISRKVEEALIVYLIENLNLVSKDRMFEIYLNAIEWGPNVYGVGEAARFYFNKRASDLSLQESIFLAGIIPRPKSFKYQFDKEGKLRDYMSGYFKILSSRMAGKGWITELDTTGLLPEVKLRGPALQMVLPDASPEIWEEEDY